MTVSGGSMVTDVSGYTSNRDPTVALNYVKNPKFAPETSINNNCWSLPSWNLSNINESS